MGRYSASLSVAVLLIALGLVCGSVGVEKRFQLVGFTSAAVTGVGDIGVFGMTGACQAEFPGSRFCTVSEVWRTVAIPQGLTGDAWVGTGERWDPAVCRFAYDYGLAVGADGKLDSFYCLELHPVACCALVPVP